MPLKNGSSQTVVSSNVKTLVHEWEKDGSIGSSHFATKQKAVNQAVAISLKKAGQTATPSLANAKSDLWMNNGGDMRLGEDVISDIKCRAN